MPKYTAKTPVRHDGKRYGVGHLLTLDAKDAAPLLALGAIEEAEASSGAKAAAEKAAAEKAAAEKAAAEKAAAEKAAAEKAAAEEAAAEKADKQG